ncbi:Uncharacterised protein [Acinetobacter baumannii]|nr:Uncharacterised protein [Acinetobacter baumannii]
MDSRRDPLRADQPGDAAGRRLGVAALPRPALLREAGRRLLDDRPRPGGLRRKPVRRAHRLGRRHRPQRPARLPAGPPPVARPAHQPGMRAALRQLRLDRRAVRLCQPRPAIHLLGQPEPGGAVACPRRGEPPRAPARLDPARPRLRHGLPDQGLPRLAAAGAGRPALHALAAALARAAWLRRAGGAGGAARLPALGARRACAGSGLLAVLLLARTHPPLRRRRRPALSPVVVLPAVAGDRLPALERPAAERAAPGLARAAPGAGGLPGAMAAVAAGVLQPEPGQAADLHHALPAAAGTAHGPRPGAAAAPGEQRRAARQRAAQPGPGAPRAGGPGLPATAQAGVPGRTLRAVPGPAGDRRLGRRRPRPVALPATRLGRAAAGELGADRAAAGSDAQPCGAEQDPRPVRRRTPRRTGRRPPSAEQRPRRRLGPRLAPAS